MPPRESTSLLGNSYQGDGGHHQPQHQELPSQKSWDFESSRNRRLWRRLMDMAIGFAICVVFSVVVWSRTHTLSRENMYQPHHPSSSSHSSHPSAGNDDNDNSSYDSTSIHNNDDEEEEPNSADHQKQHIRAHPHNSQTALTTSPSRYSKFQALGFQIYTGGAPVLIKEQSKDAKTTKLVKNHECNGMQTFGFKNDYDALDNGTTPEELWECYLGLEDPVQDAFKRLQIMRDAVEAAHEAASKDPDTLKVFVAPEFFWRGREGAYLFAHQNATRGKNGNLKSSRIDNECTEVCQILMGLEGLVADKKYKDWLFLFGTVIASEHLPTEDKYDYLFYNFAPVYKGYDPDQQDYFGKRFLVPKRYVSNIDFLTPVRQFTGNMTKEVTELTTKQRKIVKENKDRDSVVENIVPSSISDETVVVGNPWEMMDAQPFYDRDMWYDYKDELSYLGYEMIDYDWLILDNITFSVEVCLDHEMRTALNAYLADTSLGSPTRIPKSVEHWDPVARKMVGSIEHVKIPRHQAQLSLVSSSGMSANPQSLALAHNGSLILQDGESDKNGSMAFELDCDLKSWHFKGGSEYLSRTTNFTSTRIDFAYQVHATQRQVGLYGPLFDDSANKKWKDAAEGVFSTKVYKPLIRVYEPKDIARVDPTPEGSV